MTTFDFADRPSSLVAKRAGKPDQTLVTAAGYQPYGPLSSLALGNGLIETRAFTQRYFPSAITLGSVSNLLSWTYTTDSVGNISSITDALSSANNRTYGYQDNQYFLTRGDGPWGTRSWTYDRIGNRLTEVHGGTTDAYTYLAVPAPGTGHTPILASVQLGAGGTRTYQYGPAGHLQQIAQGSTSTLFTNDDAGRLAALQSTSPASGVAFRYDGRDYLTLADTDALPFLDGFETGDLCAWSAALGVTTVPSCAPKPAVHPTYSSGGLLHALQRSVAPQNSYLFHFAGRPVAQLDLTGTTEAWKYLTTDHLGTPIAATSTSRALLWQGGFEPFGADWNGAGGTGVFLRLPGQWEEGVWGGIGEKFYYNLHRWYEPAIGRYSQPDPLERINHEIGLFYFASENPLAFKDPDGQRVVFENFPPSLQADAEAAIQRVKGNLTKEPCCVDGGRAHTIIDAISSPDETVRFQYVPDLNDCGYTPHKTMLGFSDVIQIGPAAWNCCRHGKHKGLESLASTLFHEMYHSILKTGEASAYGAEKKCFDCTQ